MSRTTHHRFSLLALTALGLGAILVPSGAHAEKPGVMQLAKGVGGKEVTGKPQKNAGAGTEQSVATAVVVGGKSYVVTVYMSSDVTGNDRPTELKCSSVEMDPINGPKLVADQVQLTKAGSNDNGDREGNHPAVATDGTNIVFGYGSDANNNNVQAMAGVIDNMCNVVSKPIVISNDNNQNCGAVDVKYQGNGLFTAGYLRGGNDVIAVGLEVVGTTLKKNWDKNVINPANIGRPTIAVAAADRTVFCAAAGDQRPPEIGINCAFLNAVDGTIIVKQKTVAPSNPGAKFYANQPTVAMLDKDTFALNYNSSNGAGKNNNVKGANKNHLMIVQGNELGFNKLMETDNVAAYATHSALCATNYGTDGKRAIAIIGAPASGVGTPSMQLAFWDPAAKTVTAGETNRWTVGFTADSGFLSNIYGQNPNTQGRDFLSCTGDIKNPGHGVKGGYMSNVETFLLAPHSGRNPGEQKNALFLSFVPSKTDAPALPQQPTSLDPQGKNGTPSGTGGSGAGGSTSTGVVDPSSGAGVTPPPVDNKDDDDKKIDVTQPSGCACAVPGSSDSSGEAPLAVLAALGLAVAMISRRKES